MPATTSGALTVGSAPATTVALQTLLWEEVEGAHTGRMALLAITLAIQFLATAEVEGTPTCWAPCCAMSHLVPDTVGYSVPHRITHYLPPGGGGAANSGEAPPPLTFPGDQGTWSGTTLLPIVWEEPEGAGVSSYTIEHSIDGKQRETTTVFYNTTYYTVAIEMGGSSNCFVVTAHILNDTDLVVGEGCTNTSEFCG